MKRNIIVSAFSVLSLVACAGFVGCSSSTDSSDGDKSATNNDASSGSVVITVDPPSTTFYADEPAKFVMPTVRAMRGDKDVTSQVVISYSSSNVTNPSNGVTSTFASGAEFQAHASDLAASIRYGWEAEQYVLFALTNDTSASVKYPIHWLADRDPPVATSNDIVQKSHCSFYSGGGTDCDVKLRASIYANDYVVFEVLDDPRGARPRLLGRIIEKEDDPSVAGRVHATVHLELPMSRSCRTDSLQCDMQIVGEETTGSPIQDSWVEYEPSTGFITGVGLSYRWYQDGRHGEDREGYSISPSFSP
jgi:hypothetical protein